MQAVLFLWVRYKHISCQTGSVVMYIYFLPSCSFCIKQMRFSVCQSRHIFFLGYKSSLVLDDKSFVCQPYNAIAVWLFGSLYFYVALHRHTAEVTDRVINVNNLFSVWKDWEQAISLGLLSVRCIRTERTIRSPCLTFYVPQALKFYHHLHTELNDFFFLFFLTKIYLLKIYISVSWPHVQALRSKDYM